MRLIQPEPFVCRDLLDGDRGHSLVIPIPWTDRALRVGWRWRSWFKVGPRRYRVVAAPRFVEDYQELLNAAGEDRDAMEHIRAVGIEIQGDLRAVAADGTENNGATGSRTTTDVAD